MEIFEMTHILKIIIVFALIPMKSIFIEDGKSIVRFGIVQGRRREGASPTRKGRVTLCINCRFWFQLTVVQFPFTCIAKGFVQKTM